MSEIVAGIPPREIELPRGVRIASTVTYVVGVLSFFMALATNPGAGHTSGEVTVAVVINIAIALAVCVAGYLVRKGRKVGAYLVAAAWALPTIISLASGGGAVPGNFLLLGAMITIAFNWKSMW